MKRKRIREKVGQIFRVDLKDGYYAFGQVVRAAKFVFFNLHTRDKDPPLDLILNSPVAFKLTVDAYVIKEGIWEIIGNVPPKEKLLQEHDVYMHDALTGQYTIWKAGGGRVSGTWEDCKNLEYISSWEHGAVEQRLRDYFAGRPCWYLEADKPDWNPISMKDFYKQYGYDFHWLDDEESFSDDAEDTASPTRH